MIRIKLVFSIIVVSIEMIVPDRAIAQIPLVPYENVNVLSQDDLLENPWAGGLNSPQFSEVDLDNDGFKDLVAFERNFYGAVKTYINQGEQGEAAYVHDPFYQTLFPPLRNWMLLRDYDCDGREDIFTSVPGGVAVYRNEVAPNGIRFVQVTPLLLTLGIDGTTPLYVAPPDIPAITDLDGDGDLDILSFNIIGNTLEYHKNLSIENYGNCQELEYELKNACWGFFSEDGNNNTVTLFDTCEVNVEDPEKAVRHAGSTVLAIDLTGNGAKDLLLGDITYNNIVRLTNGGTPSQSIMVDQGTSFPENSLAVDITVFPAPYYLDVNNDGLKDLLVAPNNPNTSENFDNVWYYKNEGSEGIPVFEFRQKDFLQEGMIDLGEASFPVFFDENADGRMDIVAGSFGYYESAGIYDSRLMLLRNSGTEENPSFETVTDDYAGLSKLGFQGVYPAFGDIDGDGDQDMMIGDEEGKLHLFTNNAGPGNPADFVLTQANYKGIDVGESARPQMVDINRDGLPDLLLGGRKGTLQYHENTGTSGNAEFSSIPTIDGFGGVDVLPGVFTGYSAPFMTADSMDNYILYVGSEQGYLYLFNDIDNNLNGSFNLVDSLYLHGVKVTINGADINADGRSEFVYGEFAGGLGLLKYGIPPVYGLSESQTFNGSIALYPNPAQDQVYLDLSGVNCSGMIRISLLNNLGQLVLDNSISCPQDIVTMNVSTLPAGFYFMLIVTDQKSIVSKFLRE